MRTFFPAAAPPLGIGEIENCIRFADVTVASREYLIARVLRRFLSAVFSYGEVLVL